MHIKWTEDLRIGIEEIDNEHQGLFEEMERLYSLMRLGMGHDLYPMIIDYLNDYVDQHLIHEESYQESIGFDLRESHKVSHDAFREKVSKLKEGMKNTAVSNKELIALNLFIQRWLVDHIQKQDSQMRDFLDQIEKVEK